MSIPDEIIEKARKVKLDQYLLSKNITLKKEGNEWRIYENGEKTSRMVKPDSNKYYSHALDEGGSTLDYTMKHLGMSFKEAVEDLAKFEGFEINQETTRKKSFNINNTELSNDITRSIAYLTKTRKINIDYVRLLIDSNLISQTTENNNVTFLIKDENRKVVGMELNTTLSDRRFKQIAEGTKRGFGFNFKMDGVNSFKKSFYFESVIDMMSFWQYIGKTKFMDTLIDSIYISMGGLKQNIVENMDIVFPVNEIYMCTDNPEFENKDKNGLAAVEKFKNKLNKSNLNQKIKWIVPKDVKDWNDLLKSN